MAKAKSLTFDIDPKTGCFNVTSHVPGSTGYAHFTHNGKLIRAHSYMYELYKGPIPKGSIIRHSCDNRLCCNPDHLLIGTYKDNSRDAADRNRMSYGERHPKAKLNDDKVRQIRASRQGHQLLADKFGVTAPTIWRVRTNKIWKRVA